METVKLWVLNSRGWDDCRKGAALLRTERREKGSGRRQMSGDGPLAGLLEQRFWGERAHGYWACRGTPNRSATECIATSYQGCRPGVAPPTGSAWRSIARPRAWRRRSMDTARPRFQCCQPIRLPAVRRRAKPGIAEAVRADGGWPSNRSSECVGGPWVEHAARSGAETLRDRES